MLRSFPLVEFRSGAQLFLQLSVILAVCRAVGWLGRFAGQPPVVSEMIAGVLLGPSLLGAIAPAASAWLFPKASMTILYAISQIGLVLYMFMVGLEFDADLIRQRRRSAGMISLFGIVVPFALGVLIAMKIGGSAGFFTARISPALGALYMGAAMAITAFPVLARILYDRGISKTRIGTMTLAAGSLDDAIAWCLLAFILGAVKSDSSIAMAAIFGGAVYVLAMVYLIRPLFRWFADKELSVTNTTLMLIVVMLCAWVTDTIGIYAVFGAFICGACMPRGQFAKSVQERFGLVTQSLLVPVFFVYSGLNAQIGLVSSARVLLIAALVIGFAIIGKGLACALAARASGETWRDSWAIGVLMNARGLMELIILNIGLEKGLITSTLFTIMVLMAIVTTVMASPLFSWIDARSRRVTLPDGAAPAHPRT